MRGAAEGEEEAVEEALTDAVTDTRTTDQIRDESEVDPREVWRMAQKSFAEKARQSGHPKPAQEGIDFTKALFKGVAEEAGRKKGDPLNDPRLAEFVQQAKQFKYDKMMKENQKAVQLQQNVTCWSKFFGREQGPSYVRGGGDRERGVEETIAKLSGELQHFQEQLKPGDRKMDALSRGVGALLEIAETVKASTTGTTRPESEVPAAGGPGRTKAAPWDYFFSFLLVVPSGCRSET